MNTPGAWDFLTSISAAQATESFNAVLANAARSLAWTQPVPGSAGPIAFDATIDRWAVLGGNGDYVRFGVTLLSGTFSDAGVHCALAGVEVQFDALLIFLPGPMGLELRFAFSLAPNPLAITNPACNYPADPALENPIAGAFLSALLHEGASYAFPLATVSGLSLPTVRFSCVPGGQPRLVVAGTKYGSAAPLSQLPAALDGVEPVNVAFAADVLFTEFVLPAVVAAIPGATASNLVAIGALRAVAPFPTTCGGQAVTITSLSASVAGAVLQFQLSGSVPLQLPSASLTFSASYEIAIGGSGAAPLRFRPATPSVSFQQAVPWYDRVVDPMIGAQIAAEETVVSAWLNGLGGALAVQLEAQGRRVSGDPAGWGFPSAVVPVRWSGLAQMQATSSGFANWFFAAGTPN